MNGLVKFSDLETGAYFHWAVVGGLTVSVKTGDQSSIELVDGARAESRRVVGMDLLAARNPISLSSEGNG